MAPDFSSRKSDINAQLAIWAACPCCPAGTGHNINKPTTWRPWKELPHHFTQDPECKCDCRHKARIMCRMHPDSIDEWWEEPAMRAIGLKLVHETHGMAVYGTYQGKDITATTNMFALNIPKLERYKHLVHIRAAAQLFASTRARRGAPLVPGMTRWCYTRRFYAKDILECCGCCQDETCNSGCVCQKH